MCYFQVQRGQKGFLKLLIMHSLVAHTHAKERKNEPPDSQAWKIYISKNLKFPSISVWNCRFLKANFPTKGTVCVCVCVYLRMPTCTQTRTTMCVCVCVCVCVCSSRQSSHGECEGKVMWSKQQEWVWYAENGEPQLHSDTSFSWAHRSIVRQMKQQTCGCQSPEALAWDGCARNLIWRSLLLRPEGWKEHSQSREITGGVDCDFGRAG